MIKKELEENIHGGSLKKAKRKRNKEKQLPVAVPHTSKFDFLHETK
jgi:hypothetical protein